MFELTAMLRDAPKVTYLFILLNGLSSFLLVLQIVRFLPALPAR